MCRPESRNFQEAAALVKLMSVNIKNICLQLRANTHPARHSLYIQRVEKWQAVKGRQQGWGRQRFNSGILVFCISGPANTQELQVSPSSEKAFPFWNFPNVHIITEIHFTCVLSTVTLPPSVKGRRQSPVGPLTPTAALGPSCVVNGGVCRYKWFCKCF